MANPDAIHSLSGALYGALVAYHKSHIKKVVDEGNKPLEQASLPLSPTYAEATKEEKEAVVGVVRFLSTYCRGNLAKIDHKAAAEAVFNRFADHPLSRAINPTVCVEVFISGKQALL